MYFEANENAVLLKVTLLMAMALKPLNCKVVPYHALELPVNKRGNPFVVDMLVTEPSEPSDTQADEPSSSVTMVSQEDAVVMVVEVKKSVSVLFQRAEPDDVIELLIYSRYILDLKKQNSIIGILTDSNTWHCIWLTRTDNLSMEVRKYMSFETKEESKIIGTLPKLLSEN